MSLPESHHYLQAYEYLANLVLKARSVGYDKHLDEPPGKMGTHPPGNLNRNRAALLLHMLKSDRVIGSDWLGVSGASNFHIPAAENLKILKPNADGTMDVSGILGIPNETLLQHKFMPKPMGSDFDGMCSEVALINGLSHYLDAFFPSKGSGHDEPAALFLMTERLPCRSCSALLSEFLEQYQWVELHVAYMFEPMAGKKPAPEERSVYDLLSELGARTRAYMVELISSKDKGSKSDVEDIQQGQQWRPNGVESFNWTQALDTEEIHYSLGIVPVKPGPQAVVLSSDKSFERDAGEHSAHLNARVAPSSCDISRHHPSRRRFPSTED